MSSDIPTARKLLDEALKERDVEKQRYLLRLALTFMHRGGSTSVGMDQRPLSDDMIKSVKLRHHANPEMQYDEIADALNLDRRQVRAVLELYSLNEKKTNH